MRCETKTIRSLWALGQFKPTTRATTRATGELLAWSQCVQLACCLRQSLNAMRRLSRRNKHIQRINNLRPTAWSSSKGQRMGINRHESSWGTVWWTCPPTIFEVVPHENHYFQCGKCPTNTNNCKRPASSWFCQSPTNLYRGVAQILCDALVVKEPLHPAKTITRSVRAQLNDLPNLARQLGEVPGS